MLQLIYRLFFVFNIVCLVKFAFSLKFNDTGVCKKFHGSTWQLKCCQNYKLHQITQSCIDCPNGTFGESCLDNCAENNYGFRCQSQCNCFANETCNRVTGCEEKLYVNDENFATTAGIITSTIIVPIVAVVIAVTLFIVLKKSRHRLKSVNPLKCLFLRTQPVFAQSRHKTSDIDIEDDDPYSEIRESMMVRPMTVYGRKLSIRSSYVDPDDQYHRIQLATSLRRPNLNNSTNEYTDYTEPLDEPFLQPKNNIYEQLLIDESTDSQRNSDNAIYAEVGENHKNACSPQKHLNSTEHSDKFNFVTEVDKGDNYTERETTVQMPLNTSNISDKTDFVTEIQISSDNTTYAKVVKNSVNEYSSKLHLNTTGIPDKSNFVTGTNNTEEISENITESKSYTTDSEGEMITESESERKNSSHKYEDDNSKKKVVLNKIMSDHEDTPVVISVSVGKQTILIDVKDRNELNCLSNGAILENAITSVQMSANVNEK